MGNYNPHAPYILGQEWVPIRDASYTPDQISERGYSFRIDHSAPAVSGAVYVKTPTPKISVNVAEMINVYPAGLEDKSGPIRRVVIPVDSLNVTGFGGTIDGNADSVANPSDGNYLGMLSGTPMAAVNFPIQNYSQELFGKRILGVRLIYTAAVHEEVDLSSIVIGIGMASDLLNLKVEYQTFIEGPSLGSASTTPLILVTDLKYVDFSDTNIYLTNPITSVYDPSTLALPWRYQELLLFSTVTTPGQRRVIYIDAPISLSGPVSFGYLALEVFYCEETRVRYGGRVANGNSPLLGGGVISSYPEGPNFVQLRDTNFAIPSALPAGEYVITTTHREIKPTFIARGAPELRALRQLYALPSHSGINLDTPVVEDQEFTSTEVDVLPQITLHTATTIVTGVHPYGSQVEAPVYGTITATQDIEDDPITSTKTYAQVRFYARRFGDTTVPLQLQSVTSAGGMDLPGTVGSYASTPDNAALDIVGDIDIRADLTPNTWNPPVSEVGLVSKWDTAGNQRSYLMTLRPGGILRLYWSTNGIASSNATSTVGVTAQDLDRLAVRATLDVDNGAAGRTVTFYTAPTIDGPWTQLGAAVVQATVTSIFAGTSIAEVGSWGAGTNTIDAVFHVVEIRSGIDGTAVANPRFIDQSPGTTNFNDAAGRTWTLNGSAAIVSGLGNSVSITPDEFDALPHIVDGWREVTLRFTTGQIISASAGDTNWRWSATGEIAGNQWQVLGANGPSPTGTQTISPATYWAPNGTVVNLTWKSPNVSGSAEDPLSDAVLLFSEDPQPVSGFSLVVASQEITGVATYCDVIPSCLPTAISYVNLTWNAQSSLPVTGFGAYELQRYDSVTAEWRTIMNATSPLVTGFTDFEARVDVVSDYRIRVCNSLDFCGPWATGSITLTSPGIMINGDANSLLIFTSNEQPDSNLAYVMQWEGQPIETFAFPEADFVQLQRMFGRDFFTAFHPLERGGEQFTRMLLVNAAAIPLPSLGNFRRLRDLAWADLNYVCVRDELGNRWFASVIVPEGSARLNRTIYLAQIRVIEVTETPTPVDPEV